MLPEIKLGDTIGICSPSSPITALAPKRFRRAKAYLEAKGFKILEGNLTGQRDGYWSGTAIERAEEINELIRNPNVRCIMTTIGGMNTNAVLPYLDYEALKRDPKLITGYSDATALLMAVYAQTGIQPLYGPALVASFGELPPFVDWTFDYFTAVAMEPRAVPYAMLPPEYWTDEFVPWEEQSMPKEGRPNAWRGIQGGVARGRLIGGNLNTLQGIWGSAYMPEIKKGDILLIEDSLKDAATVERSFAWLKLCGVFERVGGILLGKHELFNDQETGRAPYEILLEVLNQGHLPEADKLPIIADFDCCHTHPMMALPLGAEIEMNGTKAEVSMIRMEATYV